MAASLRRGTWRHLPALLIAAGFLLPLAYMASGSLRRPGTAPPRSADLVPWPPTLDADERAFGLVDLGRYLLNSLAVAAVTVPLTILVASWAGFAMATLAMFAATALAVLAQWLIVRRWRGAFAAA
jgi:multiple sugar transport system permease protein